MKHTPIVKISFIKRQNQRIHPRFTNTKTSRNTVRVTRTQSIKPIESVTPDSLHSPIENNTINTSKSEQSSPVNEHHSRYNNSTSFLTSKTTIPKFISCEFNGGLRREIYTIGKKKKRKNCSLHHLLILAIVLILLLGGLSAIPAVLLTTTVNSETGILESTTSINLYNYSTTISSSTTDTTVTITSNLCTSSWYGITIIYHCDNCGLRYTYRKISYNYTAKANTTRLSFAMRREMGYFALDDISAQNLASPSIELIVNGGFETGILSPWNYCIVTGASGSGSVQSNTNAITYNNYTFISLSGSYYYLGGATTYPDYISQTFSTNISDIYLITFSYLYVGNGTLNSGDFLLSI